MLLEAVAMLCVTNTTNAAVHGLVRDGRFKTTSAVLSGTRMTYREPVAQKAFPKVEAGQTGCAELEPAFQSPRLVVWSSSPTHILPNGREDDASCRLPATVAAGRKITFVYRKGLFGKGLCKEIR